MKIIFRDFAFYDENGNVKYDKGNISLTVTENNFIEVLISRLHDCGNGVQALMLIKYSPNIDLYDVTKKIMDTIFQDLCLDVQQYKDFIINYDVEIKNPEIWNFDTNKNSIGGEWMHFTRENVEKYIVMEKQCKTYHTSINNGHSDGCIVITGIVDLNGDFTYDFPIIGSNETMEVYEKSRGNLNYYYEISSDKESDDEED
jgi:hypothetical protein